MTRPEARKSRLTIIALVALFFIPVMVAVVLNSRWVDWKPEPTRNNGELITPVVPLPGTLKQSLGSPRQWVLVRPCSTECLETANLLDRLDRALGRHADEFMPVLAAADGGIDVPASVLTVDAAHWHAFLSDRLGSATDSYLIDPLGNVMMRYSGEFDAAGVLDDVERLVKYSRFGR